MYDTKSFIFSIVCKIIFYSKSVPFFQHFYVSDQELAKKTGCWNFSSLYITKKKIVQESSDRIRNFSLSHSHFHILEIITTTCSIERCMGIYTELNDCLYMFSAMASRFTLNVKKKKNKWLRNWHKLSDFHFLIIKNTDNYALNWLTILCIF